MNKVAFIIPSMNRPELLFRQFEFYELMNSPHPIFISDSSNPENRKRIEEGVKKFNRINITYQWVPAGKDNTYQLHPLIKEKYCMIISDDDLVNPNTVTECADFLEDHPDYAACSGLQISFDFGPESFNKPFGKITRQTMPYGTPVEQDEMLARMKSVLTIPTTPFICFSVRSMETEKKFRNVSRHFSLMEDMYEFLLINMLLIPGKYKVIDRLGYYMQRSVVRYPNHDLSENPLHYPEISKYSKIYEEGFADAALKCGNIKTLEDGIKIARWTFLAYLTAQSANSIKESKNREASLSRPIKRRNFAKKLKSVVNNYEFVKHIYYKLKSPPYIDRPESKYYKDFKIFKDFIEEGTNK